MPQPTKSIIDRFRLTDRTALVTGGGNGIGRSFCHALSQAGAMVAVVDLDVEAARAVAAELSEAGGSAIAIQADVTVESDVVSMVERVVSEWGTLTIAVNNAGIGVWRAAEEISEAEWRRVQSVNTDAVFLCAREEARAMLPAGYGKIINTASMSAHISNTPQNQVAYNASKAAVLHMTRSLGAEWAPRGIRVNSISPVYTRTDLVQDLLDTPEGQSMLPRWMERIPMRRMAETSDLQGAVVFLASEASDYMTGSDVLIDGGYCAW
jgi:NAD(P)-dependent dehydrogenase (short-subunit alcohol dehydrogenase family)